MTRRPRAAPFALLFFLARSSLFRSRLTLLLLVGAVAAGVGFQVPNSANFAGYDDTLLDEGVASGLGDVRLRPRAAAHFPDGDALAAQVRAGHAVRAAVPILTLPGAIGLRGRYLGAPVIGIDAASPRRPFRLLDGDLPTSGDRGGLLVGSALAGRLGVKRGDTVDLRVILAAGDSAWPDESLGRYSMVVRGVVAGTFGAYESIFVDRAFLGGEVHAPRAASAILLYLDDHYAAASLEAQLNRELPDAQARAWTDDSPYLSTSLHATRALSTVSHAMVVAGVAIPVAALLYINVLTRRREVALLTALGFTRIEVFFAFLLQALFVGLAGAAVGCGAGYAAVRYFQAYPIFDYEGFVIRPALSLGCFLRPVLVVLSATVAAGVWPAIRAARLDPGQTLRSAE